MLMGEPVDEITPAANIAPAPQGSLAAKVREIGETLGLKGNMPEVIEQASEMLGVG